MPAPRLTDRELEVLKLVATGMNNRDIAKELFISENTVKNHVRNILEKLQLHSRMEAVMYAMREKILEIRLTGAEAVALDVSAAVERRRAPEASRPARSRTASQPTHWAASRSASAMGPTALGDSRETCLATRVRPSRAGSTRPISLPPASSGIAK